jgi:protein-tyrosine phosphatase
MSLGREGKPGPLDADTQYFAHALEDLPEDVRQQAIEIGVIQPGITLRQRIWDELETVALDGYGNLERVRLLHFLAHYPVTPYTYQVSALASRGERPDPAKLAELALRQGYRVTVNLCAEMVDGDDPAIAQAGLAGVLQTSHVPITDMETPTLVQLTGILDLLSGPGAEPTYVHCEAGKGRTGVVIACYRMAVLGWSAADALREAENFGCSVPRQQAFIQEFGELLQADSVSGRYPLRPVGSVSPTAEQLAATIHTVASSEPDTVR